MTIGRTNPAHKYGVGQRVAFTPDSTDRSAHRGIYTIVRQLPGENRDLQYRIKDERGGQERMVRESQLGQA